MGNENAKKTLRSRGGLKITLNERSGHEAFIVETPAGLKLSIQDGPGRIEISDGNGNALKFEAGGVTLNSAATVTINASAIHLNSSMIEVNAGIAKFAGVVQCDSLISNSVISASYSPGAGNVW